MSTVALARPSTVASVFIDVSSVYTTQSVGASAGTFKMKAKRVRIQTSCRVEDSTGDADLYSTYVSDIMPRTSIALVGFMVAGSAIGLQNLAATTNGDHGIKIWFHSTTRFVQGKCVFKSITIDAGRDDPYVQVTIEAVFTDTDPTKLEAN